MIAKTPASEAGLHGTYRDQWGHTNVGDVIVALNGHPVMNYDGLYNLLTEVNIGQAVHLTVLRNGKLLNYAMKTIDIAAF